MFASKKNSFLLFFLILILGLIIPVSTGAQSACIDSDADGYGSPGDPSCPKGNKTDCDDTNNKVYPGAPRICDGKDNDCDGRLDFSTDVDADGDRVPLCASDCNDNNANIFPGNTEVYGSALCSDGLDNDCDKKIDMADPDCQNPCTDKDSDGYGSPASTFCTYPQLDCNDNNAAINPGASDTNCNNIDENCSGAADEGYVPAPTTCGVGACASTGQNICQSGTVANTCVPGSPSPEGPLGDATCTDSIDNDCDGKTDEADGNCLTACIDRDEDGYGANGDPTCPNGPEIDCNDSNAAINPSASDTTCNNIDENCSGTSDEGYVSTATSCGTGICVASGQNICQNGAIVNTCTPGIAQTEGPPGTPSCSDGLDNNCNGLTDMADNAACNQLDVDNDGDGYCEIGPCLGGAASGDCDDTDPKVFPGAARICDGKDNDCDSRVDFATDVDNDRDGFPICALPGYTIGDCNDNNPNLNPGKREGPFGDTTCSDGLDNDCDNKVDSADPDCQNPCLDKDKDGYGNPASIYCTYPQLDCNDNNVNINPGKADNTCNGIDENCSGTADEGYPSASTSCGVGACAATGQNICQNGTVINTCTPGTPTSEGPLGSPTCSDGIDNDCNGAADDADAKCLTACIDVDGDGYGSNGDPTCLNGTAADCNDSNPNINPGKTDANCNGVDENCSGTSDEGYVPTATSCGTGICIASGQNICQNGAIVNTCTPGIAQTEGPPGTPSCSDGLDNNCNGLTDMADNAACNQLNVDNDGDGYCEIGPCLGGAASGDCDDTNPKVYPGAPTICDGKDNNCDGRLDFASDVDNDNDGFPICALQGYVYGDCNDNNPNINPGKKEGPYGDLTCTDGLDNDCDTKTDSADSACVAPTCSTKTSPKDGPHFFVLLKPDGTPHPNSGSLDCGKCHNPSNFQDNTRYQCQRCHADPADTSDPLNGTIKAQYPLNPPYGYGSAPNVRMHSSSVTGAKYGTWGKNCVTCHNPHQQEQNIKFGTTYGQYIKEYICFDNSATGQRVEELIRFTASSGPGSFADGPPHRENICEMCHTRTRHHRRDGAAPRDFDPLGNYVGHFDGQRCTECHLHADGFLPTGSTAQPPHNTAFFNANCQLCHVELAPGDLDYGEKVPDANCQRCHGERDGHTSDPARNEFASGNYTYEIMCVDCHDPMFSVGTNRKLLRPFNAYSIVPNSTIVNTTRTGSGSLGDGVPRTENVCETCHSYTSHNRAAGGLDDGRHADGVNQDGSYCMLCHDHNRSFMVPGPSAEP